MNLGRVPYMPQTYSISEPKLDFDDVLLVPQFTDVTTRSQVNLETTIHGVHGQKLTGIPIIAANMVGVGTFSMGRALKEHNIFTAIQKNITLKEWFIEADKRPRSIDHVFVTVGMGNHEIQKLRSLKESGIFPQMKIVIDVANGYMNTFYDFISQVREAIPNSFILAGTVCTPDAANRIIRSGADLARIGIGSGAVCTTRRVAGTGFPQFSAVQECSQIQLPLGTNKLDVVCDGGCYHPGDFAKAFGAGAKMVMAGSVFAGHKESEMEVVDGKIRFHGNAANPCKNPWLLPSDTNYKTAEGRTVDLPYKGEVKDTVEHILGGIRSACAYSNAKTLDEFHQNAQFIRVNHQLNTVIAHHTI